MRLKEGVKLAGIQPEIVLALQIAEQIYKDYGVELVVTSLLDGKHSSPNSLHYVGKAADLRTRDILANRREEIRKKLADALGNEFDVILEADHYHIEMDLK